MASRAAVCLSSSVVLSQEEMTKPFLQKLGFSKASVHSSSQYNNAGQPTAVLGGAVPPILIWKSSLVVEELRVRTSPSPAASTILAN